MLPRNSIFLIFFIYASIALGQPTPTLPDEIVIGAVVSLTGEYEIEGKAIRDGYNIWMQWVNKTQGIKVGTRRIKVKIIFQDDKSNPKLLASIYEDILIKKHHVHFILGPYSSELNAVAQPIAEKNGVILIQSGGSAETLFGIKHKYSFGLQTPAQRELRSTLELLKEYGARTIAVVHEHEPYAINVVDGIKKWASVYNMKIVRDIEYPSFGDDVDKDDDKKAQAKKKFEEIISEVKKASPDVFIGCGHFSDAVRYIEVSKKLSFNPKAFVVTEGPTNSDLIASLGSDANHLICPIQWDPDMNCKDNTGLEQNVFLTPKDYITRFQQFTGLKVIPGYRSAEATAAGLVLQVAIEQAGSLDTDKILEQLWAMDIQTFFGPIKFDITGKNVAKPMGVIQIQNNKTVLVGPKKVLTTTTNKLVYPRAAWAI